MRLFGRKKANPQETLNKIREKQEVLDKRISMLDRRKEALKREALAAKKAGDKRRAVTALKRMKSVDQQIMQVEGMKDRLDQLASTIDTATFNKDMVDTMSDGTKTLAKLNKEMDPNKIDDMTDTLNEQIQQQQEIAEAFSTPVGEIFDEDELLDELDGLEQEELENDVEGLPAAGSRAPAGRAPATEEDELAELERAIA